MTQPETVEIHIPPGGVEYTREGHLQVVHPSEPTLPMLMQQAMQQNASPEVMKGYMDLYERWQQMQAQERYANAMQEFRRRCPHITQRSEGDTGKFKFKFAAYEYIRKITDPIDADLGITTSFDIPGYDADKGMISGSIRIRVGSYFEDKHFSLRIPVLVNAQGQNIISPTQMDGQAISYFKRYALLAARDIVVTDEDDETFVQFITAEQVEQLRATVIAAKRDEARVLKVLAADSYEKVTVKRFHEFMQSVRTMKNTAPEKPAKEAA